MSSRSITEYIKASKGNKTWKELAEDVNLKFSTELTSEQVRDRYRKTLKTSPSSELSPLEYEHHYGNGDIEINKTVFFDEHTEKTPENIMKMLGYDINEWELVEWRFGEWDTSMKSPDGEPMKSKNQTIRCKLRPKRKDALTMEDAIAAYKELCADVGVYNKTKVEKPNCKYKDRLKELPGIELHLGKMAWSGDTGQDYDKNIATDRFNVIVGEILEQQEIEQASECLYCVGNDFFNSDTVDATTTKGTQQTNDLRWKKMFLLGQELNVKLINTLLENYEKVYIRLQSGNHDKMSSFYLYESLNSYYRNEDRIEFSTNLKDVQCFIWGDCSIFYSHGDSNLKRLIKSIPAEFYKEWGSTRYRELHLGHLHKEVVVDDESGLITRRVGSPTGTDQWHYEERFIGATQKYQTFLWDKTGGLKSVQYTNF